MKYFIAFLLLALVWLIGSSLYMYDIKEDNHLHDRSNTPHFENVVVDVRHSFLGHDPDQVVCYRESHRNFYVFTLVLMASVIGLVAYGFTVKSSLSQSLQKKKEEIESQNTQIQGYNTQLVSSIQYARRVQQAFFPSNQLFNNLFPNHLAINLPRDIVSGDFYWASQHSGKTILCIGDCTGHGVPAALLTMNAFNLLNMLTPLHINHPGQLMLELHKQLIKNLDWEEEVGDGMDLTMLVFDTEGVKLEIVSAHQSVLIIKNGSLEELKGERRGLGPAYKSLMHPFLVNEIPLESGMTIYGFSDGIADQFGGPEGKKFSKKRLKEMLLAFSHLPAKEQEENILHAINSWKGTQSQIDDMILVGIQV